MVEMDGDSDGGHGASPAGGSTNEFCDVSHTRSSDFWDYIPGGQLHVYYIHYMMKHHELSECITSEIEDDEGKGNGTSEPTRRPLAFRKTTTAHR